MSQLYGLLAGFFVCASTWGGITYLSADIGWLVGVFLLVFFTTTTIYLNGDEVHERQKSLSKSLTDMEVIFLQQLKMIERKIDVVEQKCALQPSYRAEGPDASQALEAVIRMVERILSDDCDDPQEADAAPQVGVGQSA